MHAAVGIQGLGGRGKDGVHEDDVRPELYILTFYGLRREKYADYDSFFVAAIVN